MSVNYLQGVYLEPFKRPFSRTVMRSCYWLTDNNILYNDIANISNMLANVNIMITLLLIIIIIFYHYFNNMLLRSPLIIHRDFSVTIFYVRKCSRDDEYGAYVFALAFHEQQYRLISVYEFGITLLLRVTWVLNSIYIPFTEISKAHASFLQN